MSVKIRVSYTDEEELQEVMKRLGLLIQSYKIPKQQAGRYYKAYIILKELTDNNGFIEHPIEI